WIADYKYFANSTSNFDYLEPYSTISAIIVGLLTFTFAVDVYSVLLSNPLYRTAYFKIFIAQGFISMGSFVFNLIRFRLALFEMFGPFYKYLSDSPLTTFVNKIQMTT
ncbi:hypothetical protein PENTCL1PPCAC_15662, partial [Pristionchus entomophagus]